MRRKKWHLKSFLRNVDIPEDTTRCWIWTGWQSNGYGQYSHAIAHRVAYELVGGNVIPEGLELDHLCRTTLCVNPDHLEPVTLTWRTSGVGTPC